MARKALARAPAARAAPPQAIKVLNQAQHLSWPTGTAEDVPPPTDAQAQAQARAQVIDSYLSNELSSLELAWQVALKDNYNPYFFIMDQSTTPFDGDHPPDSFDPSGNDFYTNIDINTGTFAGDRLNHTTILQGLGNCPNSENGCLDQRCYHVISNAAAAAAASSPFKAGDIEMTDAADNINLEADLPVVLQSNPSRPSTSMSYGAQNLGLPSQQARQMSTRHAAEPLAVLTSLHEQVHQGCHNPQNQNANQASMSGPATIFQNLHHNFQQNPVQYPNQYMNQDFCQAFGNSSGCFPCQPTGQFPNQTFSQACGLPFCGQMSGSEGFMMQPNGTQTNWVHGGASYPAAGWVADSTNLGMCLEQAAYDAQIKRLSCSSQCDVRHCPSQCNESATGDCCFDPLCTLDPGDFLVMSECCSHESCHDPEPCLEENCQGASHPCNDAACMGTAVSSTPATASVPTPPPAIESDPMINSISSPLDGEGFPGTTTGKALDPSLTGQKMDGVVTSWQSNAPDCKPKALPKSDTMGESDQFRCRWLLDSDHLCPEIYLNAEDLQGHCKKEHGKNIVKGEKGYVCRWLGCTRKEPFAQKSKLERHMQTHTGFKPVKCDICGLRLSAKQSLDQHRRTHSGELPWKCQYADCNRAFKQQSALTMHTRTHTGEKPLVCEWCQKHFSESSNLSKHRRTHNVVGNHVCQHCGKDFHRLDQLRRHLRGTHKISDGHGIPAGAKRAETPSVASVEV